MAILLFFGIFLHLFFTLSALADTVGAPPAKLDDIAKIISNIIKLLAPAAAVAFFVMLLFGGFKFMTSGGDPKAVGAARSTLTFAIIGIILVIASWLILVLVKNITGVDTTTINLPGSL